MITTPSPRVIPSLAFDLVLEAGSQHFEAIGFKIEARNSKEEAQRSMMNKLNAQLQSTGSTCPRRDPDGNPSKTQLGSNGKHTTGWKSNPGTI